MKRNSMNTKSSIISNNAMLPLSAALLTILLSAPAMSGVTIPDSPLQSSTPVPPNIMFILDDSGSMGLGYMPAPGATSDSSPTTNAPNIGPQTYARNGLYYDPRLTYQPWKDANGNYITGTTYGAAYSSATLATVASGVTDLAAAIQVFYVPKTTTTTLAYVMEPANYYKYVIATNGEVWRSERLDLGASVPTNDTTAHGCDTSTNVVAWRNCTRVTPTIRTEAEERQNFATWYSFHRTRSKIAKNGASDAFSDLGENFRVGFTTIWGGNTVAGTRTPFLVPVGTDSGLFRNLTSPVTTNRTRWFEELHKAPASGGTPLKGALQTAGTYFSRSDAAGPFGPETGTAQLACRQNFAILTTDGFWNSTNNYTTLVGNSDNTAGSVPVVPALSTVVPFGYVPANPHMDNWSDTLGDIANYYWKNDLRTDLDNLVPQSASDLAYWQHMVTYGISIGLQGTLDPVADLVPLKNGTVNSNGTTGWPDPTPAENPTRIDDLFHASVNGHGKFIAASNADEFTKGLRDALTNISNVPSSNSNASANSTSLDDGSVLFQAKYRPAKWSGELDGFTITNGTVSSTPLWSASSSFPVYYLRNILTWNGASGAIFPTATQTTALTPGVANYIRGERVNENTTSNPTGPYRERLHLLGDIINSSPAYVKETNTVFIGANDGMLHAFDSTNGAEKFAYVPGGISLANLKSVSDLDYSHRYFVDGAIVVSTREQTAGSSSFVSPNINKNILVGALGRGGKGVFALDVTTPSAMTIANVKWESNKNILTDEAKGMGNVLGRSFIAKLNNGATAVIVANGPNSVNDTAQLFIYDLNTGAVISQINTGIGPNNGLSSPAGWDNDNDGDIDYVYSGDLLGNMWKFDISNNNESTWSNAANRVILYTAFDAGTPAKRQPITGRPTIGRDPTTFKRWVFFGTGRFLTAVDPASKDVQTWYGIIDGSATISGRSALDQRKIAVVGSITKNIFAADQVTIIGTKIINVRGFEPAATLTTGQQGWYIDLVTPPTPPGTKEGERMVGDQRLVNNILVAASIIPSTDQCIPGGDGFLNAIDAFTGTSIATGFFDVNGDGDFTNDTVGGVPVGSINLGVGMGTNPLIGNSTIIQQGSSGGPPGSVKVKTNDRIGRISWREILGN